MPFRCVFHAGTVPDSRGGDSSAVVNTPDGEIPWPHVSRLSDEEMKLVVRGAVNKPYGPTRSGSRTDSQQRDSSSKTKWRQAGPAGVPPGPALLRARFSNLEIPSRLSFGAEKSRRRLCERG